MPRAFPTVVTLSRADLKNRRVFIFGASSFGHYAYQLLRRHGIIVQGFIDNDRAKQQSWMVDMTVFSPDAVAVTEDVFILVASIYYRDIRLQLARLGFLEQLHFVNATLFYVMEDWRQLELRMRGYHNCHAGKRAFLIGNGPSLTVQDLDLLKNEITFAANKIYLSFTETDWRPSYFCVCDPLVALNNSNVITAIDLPKFIANNSCFYGKLLHNACVLPYLFGDAANAGASQNFSSDPLQGLCDGGSVIYMMLQIAFFMGIRDFYFLGMDHRFKYSNPNSSRWLVGNGESNHFHKDYRLPGENWSCPDMELIERSCRYAKAYLEEQGCRLVNVSRQSDLTIFERQQLESVLQ